MTLRHRSTVAAPDSAGAYPSFIVTAADRRRREGRVIDVEDAIEPGHAVT